MGVKCFSRAGISLTLAFYAKPLLVRDISILTSAVFSISALAGLIEPRISDASISDSGRKKSGDFCCSKDVRVAQYVLQRGSSAPASAVVLNQRDNHSSLD